MSESRPGYRGRVERLPTVRLREAPSLEGPNIVPGAGTPSAVDGFVQGREKSAPVTRTPTGVDLLTPGLPDDRSKF